MLVDVYARYADTCGNEDQYFYGTYEAPSIEAAEKVFKHGLFTGFIVTESKVLKLPKFEVNTPSERDFQYGKVTPISGE